MKLKLATLVAGCAIACMIGSLGCRRASEAPRSLTLPNANVLLITLDTTRADRIGAYGYARAETPRLDRLAEDGVLFETAVTPTAFTLPAHSSIMTGLYPPYHGVRLNGGVALADVQVTLAERLAAAGYRCGAVVGAFVLDQRWGLSQGFEHFDDDIERTHDQPLDLAGVQRPADRVVDAALQWLEADDERPFFAWLHFYDPHIPYEPPEPYATRFGDRGPSGLYDGEIAFTDEQVGRVFDWLDERGLSESTVVVVVGDHGEGLGDHGEREHGYFIYDATVHVPLVVQDAGVRARGNPCAGSGADDRYPADGPRSGGCRGAGADARPVAGTADARPEELPDQTTPTRSRWPIYLQYGWSALYAFGHRTHKFIDAPRAELYDITADPGENREPVRT